MPEFFQQGPELQEEYSSVLKHLVRQHLPEEHFAKVDAELEAFAKKSVTEVNSLAQDVLKNPPRLVQYDSWGHRQDQIEVHPSWKVLHQVAAEEGLIATAYERKLSEYSRLHQFAKLFLYHPSSAFYSCPLAMTDGAARIIELLGDDRLKAHAFKHLTSRKAEEFWTSGQWMTEKEGGSDVSKTSTVARHLDGDKYALSGLKWFSSATTAEMALALGRIEGATEGSGGLSMFYIELRNSKGELNGIKIRRLKDKLGTTGLPTAELELENCQARLIGEAGHGVKNISTMLNTTRMHNAICSCAQMQRSLNLALSYARKRSAFGKDIVNHPLHQQTLFEMYKKVLTTTSMTMEMAAIFGKDEVGKASIEQSRILRLMLPIVKLYSAKQAVEVASECVEAFGGTGYVEDSGVPLMLRDSQVFPIWEGTTNILSLDLLRVVNKEPQSLKDLFAYLLEVETDHSIPKDLLAKYKQEVQSLADFINDLFNKSQHLVELNCRQVALAIGQLFAAASLFPLHKSTEGEMKHNVLAVLKSSLLRRKEFEIQEYSEEYLRDIDKILP